MPTAMSGKIEYGGSNHDLVGPRSSACPFSIWNILDSALAIKGVDLPCGDAEFALASREEPTLKTDLARRAIHFG